MHHRHHHHHHHIPKCANTVPPFFPSKKECSRNAHKYSNVPSSHFRCTLMWPRSRILCTHETFPPPTRYHARFLRTRDGFSLPPPISTSTGNTHQDQITSANTPPSPSIQPVKPTYRFLTSDAHPSIPSPRLPTGTSTPIPSIPMEPSRNGLPLIPPALALFAGSSSNIGVRKSPIRLASSALK